MRVRVDIGQKREISAKDFMRSEKLLAESQWVDTVITDALRFQLVKQYKQWVVG
jgi:hypothetical protein